MKSYTQFCPIAKGAEVFNERWTPLIRASADALARTLGTPVTAL